MREVVIIGLGMTRVDEHWDRSLRELAGEAALNAVADARMSEVDGVFVGNMLSGQANRQQHLGAYIADWIGLRFKEALRMEAACASGAAAFRAALMAVASGHLESALALGVEKMTDSPTAEMTHHLATAADADWEVDQGVSFVGLNALLMQRYMFEYGWSHDDFAPFPIVAHANGVKNPFARFRQAITLKTYQNAAMIADPINLYDSSPMGDGAAAVVIAAKDSIPAGMVPVPVRVLASAAATDSIAIHSRRDPLWLRAAEVSSKRAYDQAGLGPEQMDFFELHDAFSIMAALSLEACGFAQRGQGPKLGLEGDITPRGRIPIATMGGLKARGHPVGATGLYQIAEATLQLRHQAGDAQLDRARIAMTQNIGGSGSNVLTHILGTDLPL